MSKTNQGKWRSVFDLTHQERETDYSGTPYGFMVQLDRTNKIEFVDALTEKEERDILIEWPVSIHCAEMSGYSRFLQLRKTGQYVAIKASPVPLSATTTIR